MYLYGRIFGWLQALSAFVVSALSLACSSLGLMFRFGAKVLVMKISGTRAREPTTIGFGMRGP